MKQFLLATLTICCLLLTSCNNTSIGIIRGADGPTSILISKSGGEAHGQFGVQLEKKPVRMFNVDGVLYYDTGLEADEMPRCGTLDGKLRKTVNENEIPLTSGEANFETEGYQNATSITKEVCIDGTRIIFKKYDTYGRTFENLQYCYYMKGHLNNAAGDSEIIVLTEEEDITFNAVYAPLLSSQATAGAGIGKTFHNAIVQDKWGICFHADAVTPNGMTLKIEQFGGKASGTLQTGAAYLLETSVEDEWQPVQPKDDAPFVWNSMAYGIKKNDITEMHIDWQYAYGALKPGYYRLTKRIMDFRAAGDFDEDTYAVYFTIE